MIALDTNILVHAHRRDSSLHKEAFTIVRELAEGGAPWAICFHNFVEFYGIVSHPKIWATASTPEQIEDQIAAWKESPQLHILTESSIDLPPFLETARKGKVSGMMIHDARIASCCIVRGVTELWTADRDYSRFPALKTRNPLV